MKSSSEDRESQENIAGTTDLMRRKAGNTAGVTKVSERTGRVSTTERNRSVPSKDKRR